MRRSLFALLAALAVTVGRVAAEDGSPTTTTIPEPPPEQQTTVAGTVPDLRGRWLAVCWLNLPANQVRTVTGAWDIGERDGRQDLAVHYVHLPTAEDAAISQADADSRPWRPSPDELAHVAASWDDLPPQEVHPARVDTHLTGHDAFDAAFNSEAKVRNALWVALQNETLGPSSAPGVRQIHIYAALEARDGGYSGNFTTTLIAAAPFPIPITLDGTFQLYRVETRPRSLGARLADLFSGCRRQP
jgi:hypothetical protein